MIGLYDYDLVNSRKQLDVPNLEIMKLASYYQYECKTVCQLITCEEELDYSYDKIFFCSDNPIKELPKKIISHPNVEFHGLGFSNGIYIPLEPSIIEHAIPRTSIYKDFLRNKYQEEAIKGEKINKFLDNTYYRMYAGNERLPIPPIHPKRKVYLYDVDFFYNDWEAIIDEIAAKKPSNIVRINPIHCENMSQFWEVRAIPKLARNTTFIWDFPLPFSDLNVFFKKYLKTFLADIIGYSNIGFYLGKNYYNDFNDKHFYAQNLYHKLNLLYSFWAKGVPISLFYFPPKSGTYNPFDELFTMVSTWTSAVRKRKEEKTRTLKEKLFTKIQKAEYAKLIDLQPDIVALFEQTFESVYKRGYWRV